jgi:hypothetical protein
MTPPMSPQDPSLPRNLVSAGLPRRVRRTLERALGLFAGELEPLLVGAVVEFEEELFRMAERYGVYGGGTTDHMQTLRVVRLNRHDFVPRFMQLLESGLAGLRTAQAASPATMMHTGGASRLSFHNLSLVDQGVMDEGAVLHEIASRQESRANLVLHLLGQRFGVLAGSPAFDSERMPLGPQALCRAVRHASETLQLPQEPRLLFYRIFDRKVMSAYSTLCEKLDVMLVEEGVLPNLSYVPMRTKAAALGSASDHDDQQDDAAHAPWLKSKNAAQTTRDGMPLGSASSQAYESRPFTNWMGQPLAHTEQLDEQAAYQDLQKLLSNHRRMHQRPMAPGQTVGTPLPKQDVLSALSRLNLEASLPGTATAVDLADVKRALLAQAKQQTGRSMELSPADNDTFELIDLLYKHLQTEIREDAPATALIKRLQLTLLRVALQDSAFFVRPNHPARQLLNTVSETAAKWLAEDDFDPQLLAPLQQAVTHAVKHYDGDVAVFEKSNKELHAHVAQHVKRAETLERRHVEAARGKEKLEVAKQRAAQVLDELLGEQQLPKFTRALLKQSWADVLTLTYLRQGEGSEEWRRQLDFTRKIVEACTQSDSNAEDTELKEHIESSLKLVGYHEDEADVIARRLSSGQRLDDEEGESRTELTMKLKARVRLGEESSKAKKDDLAPRSEHEQECFEQLRLLPFGTWIEFVTNQQGDVVRRRMSWFSPVTGTALFVNQRGHRIGEHSLDSLARMMAKDQVRIVTAQRAGLVDRAWNAALNALRSLTGRREDEHEGEETSGGDGDPNGSSAGAPPLSIRERASQVQARKLRDTEAAAPTALASPSPSPSKPIPIPIPSKPEPSAPDLPPIGLIGDESVAPPPRPSPPAAAPPAPAPLSPAPLSPAPAVVAPRSPPPAAPPTPTPQHPESEPSPIGLIGDESAAPPLRPSPPTPAPPSPIPAASTPRPQAPAEPPKPPPKPLDSELPPIGLIGDESAPPPGGETR